MLLLLLLSRFSHVRLSATPWTAAYQAPASMEFSRQEYWSGVPLPSVASIVSDSVRPHRRQPNRLLCLWDSPGKNIGVGCHFLLQCTKVKSESEVAQSCLTLSDPMDCSLPGSSVHGILQARVLEWVAIAFSEAKNSPYQNKINKKRKMWLKGERTSKYWIKWHSKCPRSSSHPH